MIENNSLNEQIQAIAQTIYDKKGMNILVLDVRGISSLTDFVIIAEGHVDKHVVAIAQAVEKAQEELGAKAFKTEGMTVGDWVVLDYFHIMVHLFMPGMREKYHLEKLWPEAKIVDVEFSIPQQHLGM